MLSYIPLNPSVCLKKKGKFSFLKEGSKKLTVFFFHLIQCMHLIYQTLKKTNLAELTNKMKKESSDNGETLFKDKDKYYILKNDQVFNSYNHLKYRLI